MSVNLGDTLTSAGNFNLTGSSSISGTGTIGQTGSGSKVRFNFANELVLQATQLIQVL